MIGTRTSPDTCTSGTNTQTFTWDAQNRLRRYQNSGTSKDVTYLYDPFGRRIRKTDGATVTVSRAEAADAIGGVKQQRSVFNQIIGVTLVIAAVVVALFFALLTVERLAIYGVLKAIGARSRTLLGGVIAQATVVAVIAATIGAGLAWLLDVTLPPGAIPYQLLPSRVAISGASLLLAAIVGSAFSLRSVLRVDPASAIGRGS